MDTLPLKLLAAVGLCLILFFAGYRTGKNLEESKWNKIELERNENEQRSILSNQRVLLQARLSAEEAVRDAETEKETAVRALRDAASRAVSSPTNKLRVDKSICDNSGVPPKGTGDPQLDARIAGTRELPETIERDLRSEALRADELVESMRALELWIKENGQYESR